MNKKQDNSILTFLKNINDYSNRIPTFGKMVFFFFLVILIQTGLLYTYYVDIIAAIRTSYDINITTNPYLNTTIYRLIGINTLLIFLAIMMLYLDIRHFLLKVNSALKNALSERKLTAGFEQLHSGRTFFDVYNNTEDVLSLFRYLGSMKSSQIKIENTSLQIVLNNVAEGILIINKDKIVTHVNHKCEQMLRLIPGEILGQLISRRITYPEFLDAVDKALRHSEKIRNVEFQVKEFYHLIMDVHPIKNRLGGVTRAVVIFREKLVPVEGIPEQ